MRPSLGPRLAVEPHGPQGGRQVNRELFPLPSVHVESLEAGKLSRKVRQRIGRRRHLQEEVQSTVNVLNMMHGGTGGPMSPKGDISSGQQKVLEFIEQSVAALGSPPQLSGPEALEELRVSVGYGETPASCPLGSFDPASVSLPSGEIRPVALEKLWGEGGQQVVKEFSSQMLGPDEVHSKLRVSGDVRIYNDPKLNGPKEYGAFISRLHSLGLAEFCLEPQEEEVGLFFVKKKQNCLRLIMDCRRANLHFAEPSTVELATGDALGKLEVGRDDTLYLASADLANAFYTLELPAEWRRFFGFRRVRAVHLGVVEVNGQAVAPDTWVYPRTLVVPMGWAWALWWCQSVNERICERSGLAACHRVRDGFPIPGGSFWHLQYVDNLHVLGTDKTEVEKKFWDAVRGLREAGLTVHEIEFSESTVTMLGWQIEEKGVLRPTYKRIWRIRIAIRELLSRGRMTGQQLERLIGHMTFVSLCRREALAVLGEVYTFIRRHYLECVPIWKTVRKELMKFDGLCPLIFNNMRSGWSNTVYAVDASEWGLGVVRSEVEPGCSKQWGQHLERWRFKDANAKDPRRYVLVEDERNFVVDEDSPPPNDVERHYKTVGFEAVDRHWQVVGRFKWLRADSMPVLEARASLYAVKHFLKNSTNFGQRLLVLTDSMTAAVAYDKGRAQSHKLRRVLEQFSALALSTGLVVRTRRIPSEWNPADSVSRGGTAPSNPQRRFDDPPTVGSGSELVQQPSEKEGAGRQFPAEPTEVFSDTTGSGGAPQGSSSHLAGRAVDRAALSQEAEAKPVEKSSAVKKSRRSAEKELSRTPDSKEISETLGDVAKEESQCNCSRYFAGGVGLDACKLSGALLPRRGGSQFCELCSGFSSVSSAQGQGGSLTLGTTVNAGVAKIVPTESAIANPLRSSVSAEHAGLQGAQTRDLRGAATDVFVVPEARRGLHHAGPRHCVPSQASRQSIQALLNTAAPLERGDSVQDETVGRNPEYRPETHEVLGTSSRTNSGPQEQGRCRQSIYNQPGGREPVHGKQLGASGPQAAGKASRIQVAPRRCKLRGSLEAAHTGIDTEQRAMADVEKCQELREGFKTGAALWQSQQGNKRQGRASKKGRRASLVWKALDPTRSLKVSVFLEIFSGCGRLGRAIHRKCGWPVLLWDINFGAMYDLLDSSNQNKIIHWIMSGEVRAGHLGTPCHSFFRARDRPGGPPRLRSDQQPLGLPDLRPGDQLKVTQGNRLMRFSCRVLLLALQLHISFTLENPRNSRLWLCPGVQNIMRRRAIDTVDITFCAFGTAWRKPTKFLGIHLDLSLLRPYSCVGTKRGICAHTGCPHIPLMGQHPSGMWMTKVAEPYPLVLCRKLAQIFYNTDLAAIAEGFMIYL